MSNFIEEFKKGQRGETRGIPFGEGLEKITNDTNGIHKGRIYGVGGPEKSGKSTFVDYVFVIQAYLYHLVSGIPMTWVYYSFEIDRVSKEFDFATYFIHYDFGVRKVKLAPGSLKDSKDEIDLSPDYLRGYLIDDDGNSIKVSAEIKAMLIQVYDTRIVPLFGEFDTEGKQISKGLIEFKEGRENPTGVYKDLLTIASSEGRILQDSNKKYVGYVPNNPKAFKIVIVDHIRKLKPERNWQMKQTIDKMSEYMVILRNLLGYVFVPILHTNRNLSSTDKLAFFKGDIYPTSNDLKDSGNLGEDCNYLFTTFSPNDDQYNLKEHFTFKIRDSHGNILYPHLKSIHLASSRHGPFPKHYKTNMFGNLKKFEKI